MAVTRETERLQAEVDRWLLGLTDAQTRDLTKAWATAWDEVAPTLNRTLLELLVAAEGEITRADMRRSARLNKALALIAQQLKALAKTSRVRITGDLDGIVDRSGAAQASIIDSQLPPGAHQLVDLDAWSRLDPEQVAAIVARSTEQITALHLPLSTSAYDAVRRELIRGVVVGTNPRVTARRMVARTEGAFNGGLSRALTIARTETLDAYRAAAQAAQQQHSDVLAGWQWVAALSSRTCPACVGMHGTVHPLSEPGPLGHQQCRCTRVPAVKSWAELGLPGREPPSLVQDREAWFNGLSVREQRNLLGPQRYAAWRAGKYPMSAWAQRRKSSGWRDSYVPSPAPMSFRKAAA